MTTLLKKNEHNTFLEKMYIKKILKSFGILVNLKNGHISYNSNIQSCKCKQLKLLRHGKTIGVEHNEFMSNNSYNSNLSNDGIIEIKKISKEIKKYSPDVIILAPLNRTIQTFKILKSEIQYKSSVILCPFMLGINNSVWEGKRLDTMTNRDLYVFYNREYLHNIFVKPENGDSWGDVLMRCAKLLKMLNSKYNNQKVLLISQASIYQGLKILLHQVDNPWDGYSAKKTFSTTSSKKTLGYGKLFDIK